MPNWDNCDKNVQDQILGALRSDPKRIGDVYRMWVEHKDNYESIASELQRFPARLEPAPGKGFDLGFARILSIQTGRFSVIWDVVRVYFLLLLDFP